MATALSVPVVRPARRWVRTPRSGPARRSSARPMAVTTGSRAAKTQPTRGRRGPRGVVAGGPQAGAAAGRRRPRPAGGRCVGQLPAAVQEAAEVASRRPVAQFELALFDPEAGADCVDRHTHLAAEPRREREAGGTGSRRERPLSGERLARLVAAAEPDELAPGALGDPEASALPLAKGGDRHVGAVLDERREGAVEVGVAEEQRPGPRLALRERERLPLAQPRQPHHFRA